jgi:hypothetical protein
LNQLKEKLIPLRKLVGKWKTTGTLIQKDDAPSLTIEGTDTYAWLPGEFFLLHTADVKIGEERHQTHEVIGYEPGKDCFFTHYFESKGESGTMIIMVREPLWVIQGGKLRFTGGFLDQDRTFSGVWEQLTEEEGWVHLMEIRLEKD